VGIQVGGHVGGFIGYGSLSTNCVSKGSLRPTGISIMNCGLKIILVGLGVGIQVVEKIGGFVSHAGNVGGFVSHGIATGRIMGLKPIGANPMGAMGSLMMSNFSAASCAVANIFDWNKRGAANDKVNNLIANFRTFYD
jgi:hypothetical protein